METAQEIFEKTARHLFTQGKQSKGVIGVRNHEMCAYRFEKDGEVLRCAAGLHIPVKMYRLEMEGKALRQIIETYNVPRIFVDYEFLITKLQTVHDMDYNWENTKKMRQA